LGGAALSLIIFDPAQAQTEAPSFTFAGSVLATVVDSATFTFPASIKDVGGPATNYNAYFQIYDINFHYLSQTYYTGQTWSQGQTLDFNPTLTAPSTTGFYFVEGLVFDTNYTGPIVSDSFFGTFTTKPAAVPELSSALTTGLLLVFLAGLLILSRRPVKQPAAQRVPAKINRL